MWDFRGFSLIEMISAPSGGVAGRVPGGTGLDQQHQIDRSVERTDLRAEIEIMILREVSEKRALPFDHWDGREVGQLDQRVECLDARSGVLRRDDRVLGPGDLGRDRFDLGIERLRLRRRRHASQHIRFLPALQHGLHRNAEIGRPFRRSLGQFPGADHAFVKDLWNGRLLREFHHRFQQPLWSTDHAEIAIPL
jgi:hypothetical protein